VLKDVVVNAIMSNYSIGPKLYGIFPAGRLEELIPVRKKNIIKTTKTRNLGKNLSALRIFKFLGLATARFYGIFFKLYDIGIANGIK
jgi:hypothetical protein